MYELNWPGFSDSDVTQGGDNEDMCIDITTLRRLGEAIAEVQRWTWLTTIDEDRMRAIAMLERDAKKKQSGGM